MPYFQYKLISNGTRYSQLVDKKNNFQIGPLKNFGVKINGTHYYSYYYNYHKCLIEILNV